jgi:hypothetical protein
LGWVVAQWWSAYLPQEYIYIYGEREREFLVIVRIIYTFILLGSPANYVIRVFIGLDILCYKDLTLHRNMHFCRGL